MMRHLAKFGVEVLRLTSGFSSIDIMTVMFASIIEMNSVALRRVARSSWCRSSDLLNGRLTKVVTMAPMFSISAVTLNLAGDRRWVMMMASTTRVVRCIRVLVVEVLT